MRDKFVALAVIVAAISPAASAQTVWDVFEDLDSASECGIVNAVNAGTGRPLHLVVLSETAQMMIVSGTDSTLLGTFVDLDNGVFNGDEPKGFIEYVVDGDGFRTVWWRGLDGGIVEVDAFTGEVFAGTLFPDEFLSVACDACEFVDFPPVSVCGGVQDSPFAPIVFNFCGAGMGSGLTLMMGFCGYLCLRSTRR